MLAVLGFLTTEAPLEFHPLFNTGARDIGPAIRHLDEVRAVVPIFFEILTIVVGAFEFNRALVGWTAPDKVLDTGLTLKEEYYPGDGEYRWTTRPILGRTNGRSRSHTHTSLMIRYCFVHHHSRL